MKVLICSAGNSIAISLARYLLVNGHEPVLADTVRHARVFYSRYCRKRYIFKDPKVDREGFTSGLSDCIRQEKVELVVPTSDWALFVLSEVNRDIFRDVRVTFPLDNQLIRYVTDKKNIPSICRKAGIARIPTYPIDRNFRISELERISPPYVKKPSYGVSGEGFKILATRQETEGEVNSVLAGCKEGDCLIQKYMEGSVYGAVGVYEGNVLRDFHSYKYLRRYPEPAGNPTVCTVEHHGGIRDAMSRVLESLGWRGFCQMDFILEKTDKIPYLVDINPVHWYSVPNSFATEYSSLSFYLGRNSDRQTEAVRMSGPYTTIGLVRELQRIMSFRRCTRRDLSTEEGYWRSLRGIRLQDFYWDPLPVILAPYLRFLRRHE